jgi:hypothetical protein
MKKKKILKIWNGRGYEERTHLYLAAYSRADAARLLVKVYPHTTVGHWIPELTNYFCEGCWGNTMEGITPERGIWIIRNEYTAEQTAPERIYPKVEGRI